MKLNSVYIESILLSYANCFVFFALLTTSCTDSKKHNYSDLNEPIECPLSDNKQTITDSLSLIAWGDTRFGMTKQEVMKSNAFSKEKDQSSEKIVENGWSEYEMDYEKRHYLSETYSLKELYRCCAYFEQNELYEIELQSMYKDASYIKDMLNDCAIIMREFESKYNVSIRVNQNAELYNFKGRNDQMVIATITIGTKKITAYLNQSDGRLYSYTINISNSSFPRKKYNPSDEEVEKYKKEDSVRVKTKENSF